MSKNYKELVKSALSGDESAFEELYTMTKDSAYFIALSMTHNEEDAMDILQESYIKAFTRLNTLDKPESFESWLKRIVVNKCNDFLRQKKSLLFSDVSDEIEINKLDEETDTELIPHESIDKKEASRLIMEIINSLDENKRLVIIMYYYNGMSTREIAEALDLTVSTTKYYLSAARKEIRTGLEKLDKEGTRLYAVIPFTIFPSLMGQAAGNANAPVFSVISKKVMAGVNAGGKVSAAASSTAAKAGKGVFLKTTASKIIAGAAAVAIVGGGVTAAVLISNNNNSVPVENSVVSQNEPVSQPSAEEKPESSEASEVSVDTAKDYEYEIVANGVVITRYNGKDTEVVIPDTIEGKPVVKIGEISEDENGSNDLGAFQNKPDIVSIDIPDSVTTIGDKTFSYCSKLSELNIPKGVTEIGNSTFSGCIALKSITIPDSVTKIGNDAFSNCRGFTDITIPGSVKSFGDNVFNNCQKLASVKIENGVTTIGNGAFSDCTSLTNIDIPNTVTVIGDTAFSDCTSLTNIDIPNTVTVIGDIAFSNCTSLVNIDIPNTVTNIGNRVFSNCTSLTNIDIPNTVTDIGSESFSSCTALTSIAIPDSVEIINYGAFSGCTSLASVNVSGNYTKVDPTAFDDTQWYNSQPDGVVYVGKSAIKYKGEMPANTIIELKSDTTRISDGAFSNCINLTGITIPDEVVSIGPEAFSGCTALSVINIPDSVTHIDEHPLGGNTFTDTAWYASQPDGVVYIGKVAYKYKGEMPENTIISIKEGTTEINSRFTPQIMSGQGKEFYCPNLISLEIPDSVEEIGAYAFQGCVNLTSLDIPDSVTKIGDNAFSYCTGLTVIDVPDSVTEIDGNAFAGCTGVTDITVPEGTFIGVAFAGCDNITTIHGKSGSDAEEYAKENNIKFVAE